MNLLANWELAKLRNKAMLAGGDDNIEDVETIVQKSSQSTSHKDGEASPQPHQEDVGRGAAQLVTYFAQKKHLEFTPQSLGVVVPFLNGDIHHCVDDIAGCQEALQALSFILFLDGSRCSAFEDNIVKTLLREVLDSEGSGDMVCVGTAFGCLGNLLQRKALKESQAPEVNRLALHYITLLLDEAWEKPGSNPTTQTVDGRLQKLKVLHSALRVIQGSLLAFGSKFLQAKLQWLIGSLCRLVCDSMQVCKEEKRIRQQNDMSASESEMSDSDVERKSSSSRVLKQLEKLRLSALEVLGVLCQVDRKIMQTQWERFLPQRNGCILNLQSVNLLTVVVFDEQPRVRAAGFHFLSELLSNSPVRVWLSQPRPAAKNAGAFVPMSVKISHIVEEIHYALGRVLGGHERNPTTLEQAHQCAMTMLRAVPYEVRGNEQFFMSHFLKGCGKAICERLTDSKVQDKVRMGAAGTCAALVSAPKERLESVADFVNNNLVPTLQGVDLASSEWAMALVGSLCEQYAREVSRTSLWGATHCVLMQCFASRLPSSRRAAVGLVERILRRDKLSEPPITADLNGWNEIISIHLPRALRDTDPDVRSCAAVCVSEIRTEGWALVSDAQRRECVSGILSAYGGKEETQRATLTALSAMALVPEFRTADFLKDTSPLILLALDVSNLQVRARAATALANLVYDSNKSVSWDELISEETRHAMVEACITHVPDHDKVAAPCYRALGSLTVCFSSQRLDPELAARVTNALLDGAAGKGDASAKVQWSACASIGLILARSVGNPHSREFIEVLLDQAAEHENFKVRIAAVSALQDGLQTLASRSDLCALVRETLGPAFLSLANSRSRVDVSQARFADKLSQTLKSLLISLSDTEWPESDGDLQMLLK